MLLLLLLIKLIEVSKKGQKRKKELFYESKLDDCSTVNYVLKKRRKNGKSCVFRDDIRLRVSSGKRAVGLAVVHEKLRRAFAGEPAGRTGGSLLS